MALQELADQMSMHCFCLSDCSRHVTQVVKATPGHEVYTNAIGGNQFLKQLDSDHRPQ